MTSHRSLTWLVAALAATALIFAPTLASMVPEQAITASSPATDTSGTDSESAQPIVAPGDLNTINTCEVCESGVRSLNIAYLGSSAAIVTVLDGTSKIFDDMVMPGGTIELAADGNGTFGARLDFFIDFQSAGSLPTDCSFEIGPFLIFGPDGVFEIINGFSLAGPLCPAPVDDLLCDLRVEKTCVVTPPAPSGGDDCDGKVVSLTFEYTGEGCEATTNQQEGKVECEGNPGGQAPVGVEITKDEDKVSAVPNGQTIGLGETFVLTTTEDKFGSETKFDLVSDGDVVQSLVLHTSCSKPLSVGDVFGAVRLVAMTTTEGGITTLPVASGPAANCEAEVAAPIFCDDDDDEKPETMTWQYTGGGCAASDNVQGDKAKCKGEVNGNAVAEVDPEKGDKFDIAPGESFQLSLNASKKIKLENAGGKEENEIHTSCSQPFAPGDVYGSLTLVAIDGITAEPNIEVTYGYRVTNFGNTVYDLRIDDDQLGAIAEGLVLDNSATTEHQADTVIHGTTTNIATVSGRLAGGTVCSAEATTTVTITEPEEPLPPFECEKPIDQLSMIWVGADTIRVKAWKGDPGETLLADVDGIAYGDILTVDGYAGSPNDVYWEIFRSGSGEKLGESKFHLSCSDDDMDGEEDCGKLQGNAKDDDEEFINSWVLAGMVDDIGPLVCPIPDPLPNPIPLPDPNALPFECKKPIDSLTMTWAGNEAVRVRAWKGNVGSTLLADVDGIGIDTDLKVDGFAGSPNDVYWEVFRAGTNTKLGESKFHLSCSDDDMDGPEDCGKAQGNGKDDKNSLLNLWRLEGMVDDTSAFVCTQD